MKLIIFERCLSFSNCFPRLCFSYWSRSLKKLLLITSAILLLIICQKSVILTIIKLLNWAQLRFIIVRNPLRCNDFSFPLTDVIHWTQNRWQTMRRMNISFYLYSAYFDDRPSAGEELVRVNLMSSYNASKMFCHLWYNDYPYESFVLEGVLTMTTKYKKNEFVGFILSCPVPIRKYLPKYVSVTEGGACMTLTTLLPIQYEFHKDPPMEFGVCVVNGHGRFTPQEMIEWFEFYRLMGVEEFNLYNTSYKGVDDVLDYYVNNKTLILNQMPHPLGLKLLSRYSIMQTRNLHTTCLNDCMMRNMYRYRYLVVVDHDEFIVPRGNVNNYHDLVQQTAKIINSDEEIISYSVLNAYFLKTFPPDFYRPSHLKTTRYRYRSKPMEPFMASKSIVNPRVCFNLWNNFCQAHLPLYHGNSSHFIPYYLALLNHYRYCSGFMHFMSCDDLHSQKTADDSMLRFELPLRNNVEMVLRLLNVQF